MDINKIVIIVKEQLGSNSYHNYLLRIADILKDLDQSPELESSGAEEYVAQRIIDDITGKRPFTFVCDLLDVHPLDVSELDAAKSNQSSLRSVGSFTQYRASQEQRVRSVSLRDRLQQLEAVAEQVKEGKLLTQIKRDATAATKETANDWLSNITGKSKDGQTTLFQNKINKIREMSKANARARSMIQRLRNLNIPKSVLQERTPQDLYATYNLQDLGFKLDGVLRKYLERLRKEMT